MPMYEFACPSCGHQFEEIVRASAADTVVCPSCGYEKPARLLSTFARVGESSASASSSSSSCGGGSGHFT